MKTWAACGTSLIALGIILGAFAAHALKKSLDEYSISIFEKAIFYHFLGAIGILLIVILYSEQFLSYKSASISLFLLLTGTVIFSGSLYVLAISGLKWLGMITPIGGLAMIGAWVFASFSILKFG